MYQTFAMGIVERQRHLPRELDRVVHRQLHLAADAVTQAFAAHVGHGVPELTGGLSGVEYGQDMRVLQPAPSCGSLARSARGRGYWQARDEGP
jgi:hypothetical protein